MIQFTQHDRLNPLWSKLQGHWAEQLAALRAKNDGPLGPEQTAALRGEIKQVKAFLAMAEEAPHVESTDAETF